VLGMCQMTAKAVLGGGVVERVWRHRDHRRRDNVRPLLLMRKVRGPVGVGENGGRGRRGARFHSCSS